MAPFFVNRLLSAADVSLLPPGQLIVSVVPQNCSLLRPFSYSGECLVEEDYNWEAIASLSSLAIVAAAGFAWLIRRVCCRKQLSPLAPDVNPFPSLKVKGFGFPDGEAGGSEEELNDNVYVSAPIHQSSPLVSPILEVPAGGPSQQSKKKVVTAEITSTAEGAATGDLLTGSSRNLAPVIAPSQGAPETGTLRKPLDLDKTFTRKTSARSSLRASSLVDVSRAFRSRSTAAINENGSNISRGETAAKRKESLKMAEERIDDTWETPSSP
ncbi:unnamed protein product [Cyprideis torosa]|uniref:Uncharacterized protein n=1 Tax=Cyprideis torosa TaxID=163714 RepID=A0A7R8W8I5_9CRUS|nr:unnamed protein product [Cyprideis torosa]CAG0888649.1 unnamed protein product [Cyprideis torosa]